MIRCMVVDDLQSIREHFKDLLDSSDDIETVALASNGREAVELALEHKPDIILMDIQLEYDVAGIDAAAEIMSKLPNTKIIILTVHNNDRFILDAYLAGAVDYIIKYDDSFNVLNTIRTVYNSENFIGPLLASKLKENIAMTRKREDSLLFFVNNYSNLTSMEKKIIKHLYCGKKRREIAEMEFISLETVKTHVSHILKKLSFQSTSELIKFLTKIKIFDEFDL